MAYAQIGGQARLPTGAATFVRRCLLVAAVSLVSLFRQYPLLTRVAEDDLQSPIKVRSASIKGSSVRLGRDGLVTERQRIFGREDVDKCFRPCLPRFEVVRA
jgi:hypothetical protein